MAARNALLKYLRVNAQLTPQSVGASAPFGVLFRRYFSDDVRGSFLDKSEVTPEAQFQNDLGLYSLDAVEVVMALEEEFGFEIPDNEADKISSIKLAVDFIASHPQAK
ncbi:hypothetical protein QQ045_023919 [Rhodiola kirilowii]